MNIFKTPFCKTYLMFNKTFLVIIRKQNLWFVEGNFTSLKRLLFRFCFTSFPLMSFRKKNVFLHQILKRAFMLKIQKQSRRQGWEARALLLYELLLFKVNPPNPAKAQLLQWKMFKIKISIHGGKIWRGMLCNPGPALNEPPGRPAATSAIWMAGSLTRAGSAEQASRSASHPQAFHQGCCMLSNRCCGNTWWC